MANKHFFKPLLPGFHSHLTIPVAFFSKYIEGRNEQKMGKLRSDASKITWEVKIEDGQKLTDGWKDFALAHDLRIGDILIFRQEKNMVFHVTLLGPSCCEIQYESCLDDENNLGKIPKKKNVKKNPRKETESSSLDPSCFVANVSLATLRYDTLYFPKSFSRANDLDTERGEIVLMNEKGRSWTLALRKKKSSGTFYITRGWSSFCSANGLKAGESSTFKLIQGGRTLVLRLSATESKEEEESSEGNEVESLSTEPESEEESNLEKKKLKKNPKRAARSSSLVPSCFVANISPATLHYDTLCLPRNFASENGLDTRCGEIVLMNEKGRSWTLNLKRKKSCGTMYITRGWTSFCSANGLRAGSFSTFKLIQRGGTLVLRLSPTESEEEEDSSSEANEIKSLSTEPERDEESNQDVKSFKKYGSRWKASSSPSKNRFLMLTLKPYHVKKYTLFLPVPFTKMHGINEETKMNLLDKNGVKWSTNLRSDKDERIRLVGGWKDFFKANCVKTGESSMLKLIWEGYTSCVLKFCSKVKQETK